jgi:hypothetical protein
VDPDVQQTSLMAYWSTQCQSVTSHGHDMGHSCHPDFRALITGATTRYVRQDPPTTREELSWRNLQSMAMISLVGVVCEASRKVMTHAHAASQIYQKTKEFCEECWPDTRERAKMIAQKSMAFTGYLSSIN